MTVNTTTNRVSTSGNGVTTAFPTGFPFLLSSDLVVLERNDTTGVETVKTITTHYTVSGGSGSTGTVTMLTAPATGVTLVIYRDPPLTQLVDLVNNDSLPVETAVEQPLDKVTMSAQRTRELVERSLRLPDGDTGFTSADMKLPSEVDRAGHFLAFDADGKPIASAGSVDEVPVSTFMETLLDDTTASAARTTLGVYSTAQVDTAVTTAVAAEATARDARIAATSGWRNHIINGNFDLWQRGTSLAAATGSRMLADHWNSAGVGSTCAPSRQAFTAGQTAVPGEPRYFHRVVVASSAGAGNNAIFNHLVENCRTFADQTITLSFYAKADAAKNICVEMSQFFNNDLSGDPVSDSDSKFDRETFALTTSWQKFTWTVEVPGIVGADIGSSAAFPGDQGSFQILWWLDAGSTYNSRTNTLGQQSGTFDFARVQCEISPIATDFEQRPLAAELAMCQRYYHKTYNVDVDPGTVTSVGAVQFTACGTGHVQDIRYPVPMYRDPTHVFYNPTSGATGTWRDVTNNANRTVGIGEGTGTTGDSAVLTSSADLSTNRGHYTADAELI